MVEDVAQFSIRGGIFDVYSFGMAEPVRAEFWGDEIVDLRHFDLASQRSSRAVDLALVLPVDGHVREDAGDDSSADRSLSLLPPDTLLFVPRGSHIEPELQRTWDDAQHHIDLARRRGEDVPEPRRAVRAADDRRSRRCEDSVRSRQSTPAKPADVVFPLRPPEAIDRDIKQLKRLVRDGTPTIILCDNEGQAERLDELLGRRRSRPVARRAVDRRAGRRIHRSAAGAGRAPPVAHRPRNLPARAPHPARAPLHHGDGARYGVAQAGRFRRPSRARRRDLSRHRDDLRRPEHDRGRGRRVRGRRPAQRPAVSHRPARAVSLGERRLRGFAAAAPAQARRATLGAAAREGRASRFRR